MINKITTTLRSFNRGNIRDRKLKILLCPTHEAHNSYLAQTGHEFYMVSGPGIKTWDFHTRVLPKNVYYYTNDYKSLRGDVPFDLILTQEVFGQFPVLHDLAQKTGLPLVRLEHTEPIPQWPKAMFNDLSARRGDVNVFITEHSKKSWGGRPEDVVINHGLDETLFTGWTGAESRGLSIVNKYRERELFCGYSWFEKITKELGIPVKLIGDNPGLSESVNGVENLVGEIAKSRFFLNTSLLSPVPLSLIEALMVGCPVVSTAKQQVPSIITHGVNGFLGETPEELATHCKFLLEHPEIAKRIGESGRQTAIEKFGIKRFIEQWNDVFYSAVENYKHV